MIWRCQSGLGASPPSAGWGGRDGRARAGDALWLPNTTRPDWLDGSLPGDRGFDPLGLAKPSEYLQARPRRAGLERRRSLPEAGDSAARGGEAPDAPGLARRRGAPARPPRDLAAARLARVPPGPLGACSCAAQQGSCIAGRARCMGALK